MLSNANFLAKIRFDTAENEPAKICKILPNFKIATFANFAILEEHRARAGRLRGCPRDAAGRGALPRRGRHRRRQRASVGKISANFARFRLYRRRSLQVNTRFAAFFKIYQIL